MSTKAYISDTTNGQRIAIALAAIGVPHQLIYIDLAGDFRHSETYKAINPSGRIPAYVDGDLTLTQTYGILLHLALTHEGLLPTDSNARAEALDWFAFQVTDLSTMGMAQFYLRNRLEPPQPEGADLLKDKAAEFYAVMEEQLEKQPFLTSDTPGLVDIAAWPMLAEFEHEDVANPGSNLARWRDSFREWGPTQAGLANIEQAKTAGDGGAKS